MGMDQITKKPSKPKRAYINRGAATRIASDAPRDAVKVEFANRLQRAYEARGWNQSELARQATKFMPEGQTFNRDAVSTYVRAYCLPSPAKLHALARALHMEPEDLLPTRGIPSASDESPPFDMRQLQDGRVWLRVNQAVDWDVALEVMKLLKSRGDK